MSPQLSWTRQPQPRSTRYFPAWPNEEALWWLRRMIARRVTFAMRELTWNSGMQLRSVCSEAVRNVVSGTVRAAVLLLIFLASAGGIATIAMGSVSGILDES